MRILHVLGKLDRGGVETWLVQVLRHVDRQKYRMDFLVHSASPGAYDEEVRALGSRIIPCLSPFNPALYARNFRRVLREYGPYDVVHSHVHHYSGYVLMLAAMCGVPVRIAHSHTSAPAPSRGLARKTYLSLMRGLIKRNANLGMTISSLAGDSLMPSWRHDRKWYLRPYGIETSPFCVPVDRRIVRQSLGIPTTAKVVAHVGRFVAVKNHELIVRIADELRKVEPEAVFLLVGDGPLRAQVESLIRQRGLSGLFVLTGLRSDIPELLKGAADTFIFPSFYEGLGIALMEAQLAGLPCVASDVIPREAELVPGIVTWISLGMPPRAWADALRKAMSSAGTWSVPELVREKYSIDSSVSHITTLYERGIQANAVR